MKAKLFWLILSLGALLLTACSSVMTPPPGDFNISARMSPQDYVVNGVPRPELTLTRGTTYTFSVNASGHPFIITTSSTGGPGAPEDVAGVTGEGAAVGTVTFTPDMSTPDTVYYQCAVHTGMGNAIHVID
jgi:plastocyanin